MSNRDQREEPEPVAASAAAPEPESSPSSGLEPLLPGLPRLDRFLVDHRRRSAFEHAPLLGTSVDKMA
jgi:hypothetical protein